MIEKFHFVTTDAHGITHELLVENACSAGVRWVQLRVKDCSLTEWLRIARAAKEICERYSVKLIVNDNVVVAREVNAEGVHLGRLDMDPQQARHMLGGDAIIGGTANTEEDVERLIAARVDYIGLGPFRETGTKKILSPVLGKSGVRRIIERVRALHQDMPVIVIGGVAASDIPVLLQSGAYGVAVSSAVASAEDRSEAVREFMELLYESGETDD